MTSELTGSLEETRVPEILSGLFQRKETGTLFLNRQHIEKNLYLEEGKVVFASSNDPDEQLGALLLRRNKVTYHQLQESAPKVDRGKRLGTVLVIEEIIQPSELYQAVMDQIKEMVYSVFDWDDGRFEFRPGPLSQKEVITLNLSAPELIINGMQRIWRWSWIRKAVPSLDAVFRKKDGWSPIVRKMSLTREMETILDLFDRPRTLIEVLQISDLGNFETCRLIWSFLILGIIEEILVAPEWAKEAPAAIATQLSSQETTQQSTQKIPLTEQTTSENASEIALEGPTLKVQFQESAPDVTPVYDLEQPLVDQAPFPEPSFSDLAEFSESAEAIETTAAETEMPSIQPWETEIEPRLKDFNEIHRYLYEMITLELGNGSGSFLSKVFKKASTKYPLVFEGVIMNEYGELSESSLLLNIQGNLVQDYQKALDFLISEERSMITLFLDMKRVDIIESGLKRLLDRRTRVLS
jgi:Domain of unknown function (DUF4388)